jgi:thioredoxin reductase
LGARTNDVGCLEVDAHQRTTVDGVYAAGDVVSDLHQIAVATGHAAIAATQYPQITAGELQEPRVTLWITPPPEVTRPGRN